MLSWPAQGRTAPGPTLPEMLAANLHRMGRQGEAVGFRRPAALLYLGCPTAQHAARLLQRNVRFAAAQHSLCSVSRAFWCYATQQGMGKASCLSVSFLTSLPLGLA